MLGVRIRLLPFGRRRRGTCEAQEAVEKERAEAQVEEATQVEARAAAEAEAAM